MSTDQRSLLSQFLVLLRNRRGISAQYLAHRLGLPIVQYVLIEESPERMPMCDLHRILKELGISSKEFMDFSVLSEYVQSVGQVGPPGENGTENAPTPNLSVKDILGLFATENSNFSDV